jgi:regulator of protease activity HflC (stomatin/prohibitin superfamily)
MASLTILNAAGDARIMWDQRALAEGDLEAQAALAEAERLFAESRARGAEAFVVRQGDLAQRVATLNPACDDDIVMIPRMVGG